MGNVDVYLGPWFFPYVVPHVSFPYFLRLVSTRQIIWSESGKIEGVKSQMAQVSQEYVDDEHWILAYHILLGVLYRTALGYFYPFRHDHLIGILDWTYFPKTLFLLISLSRFRFSGSLCTICHI